MKLEPGGSLPNYQLYPDPKVLDLDYKFMWRNDMFFGVWLGLDLPDDGNKYQLFNGIDTEQVFATLRPNEIAFVRFTGMTTAELMEREMGRINAEPILMYLQYQQEGEPQQYEFLRMYIPDGIFVTNDKPCPIIFITKKI